MRPFRYTSLVALNLGTQFFIELISIVFDAVPPKPPSTAVQGAILSLQLPIGWIFRLWKSPHWSGVACWVVFNALLWAAFWEWILCRFWPRTNNAVARWGGSPDNLRP